MDEQKKRLEFRGTNLLSLIPLVIFVVFCVAFFVVFKVFEMEALCMGGIIALIIGSLFSKDWAKYWEAVVNGMASPMMNTLALILLVVGVFAKLMSRGGVAQGFVWLGNSMGLQGGMFVVFTFVATSIISMATGTSIGTLFSGFPILYPSGILLGAHPLYLAGAILSGAIFGDNVAPISDTTIASATSQRYLHKEGTADIGGVVATRMKYALAAGLIACVLFYFMGNAGEANIAGKEILMQYMNPKGLIMLIPVVVLLAVAVIKRDIFVAITWGIISGTVIGLVTGIIGFKDIISVENGALQGFAIDGIKNMLGTVGYLYAVAGIMGVLNESGTMDKIIEGLLDSKFNNTVIGSEFIMGIGIMVSSVCLGAANGPAIIMFGPIADKIGQSRELHPYRRANLLDGFASTLPVIIPFTSSFIFIVITCVNGLMTDYSFIKAINPMQLSFASFHCIALFFVLVFSVITGWGREYEGSRGEAIKKQQQLSNGVNI
ncbi:Na+/H+ antiporter NhaC family protein [Lutispora saccharofermentans]|uniref:Na+/H+ antiporter NhaC family protein n=1 Tax=Lutispora saccharofermentans TaxID=3024236 RepID=A0ABT1NG34_9FIRM|nr:Na+/H+ antiporter NhaC family protein [Lutispora saccharofermentans]MCQ1530197.1 Na+/H+ antiporter NhaC family protein [Lutispora saccharofermentans]